MASRRGEGLDDMLKDVEEKALAAETKAANVEPRATLKELVTKLDALPHSFIASLPRWHALQPLGQAYRRFC